MPRRVSLPAADELFRTTGGSAVQPSAVQPSGADRSADETRQPGPAGAPDRQRAGEHTAAQDAAPSAAGSAPERSGGGPEATGLGHRPEPSEHSGRGRRPPVSGSVPEQNAGRTPDRTDSTADRGGSAAANTAPRTAGAPEPTAAGDGRAAHGTPRRGRAPRRPSGRERHDEKITVYVSAEELMDLEHARLVLRGDHGLAVDRGRVVREAVAVVLADLESRGDASILVRRLRGR